MRLVLHGGILGRHAERVPAHRVDDVEALGPAVARHHVAHGVVAHVAHVDAPRRIGEHLEDVVFLARVVVRGREGAALGPDGLPLRFGLAGVVAFDAHDASCAERLGGRSVRRQRAQVRRVKRPACRGQTQRPPGIGVMRWPERPQCGFASGPARCRVRARVTIAAHDTARNVAAVRQRIAALRREIARPRDRGRATRGGELVAVSKTYGPEAIAPVIAAGQRVFGENRVQEAKAKWPALQAGTPGVELHLIGPLQSNKAREAVELFDVIETVDRPRICRSAGGRDRARRAAAPACSSRSTPAPSRRRPACCPRTPMPSCPLPRRCGSRSMD